MAEVFGLISGTVGIAAAFTACVDCFDLVQAGRHFERDFATENLKLECARYRLGSWGDAVDIYATPPFATISTEPSVKLLVEKLLFQILSLFQQSQKVSEHYSNIESEGVTNTLGSTQGDARPSVLTNSLRAITNRRKKGPSLVKRTTWAVYHQDELNKLVGGLTTLLDELEKLLHVPSRRSEIAARDADELSKIVTTSDLAALGEAASRVDTQLERAVKSCVGHEYTGIVANDASKVLNGDAVSEEWKGAQFGGTNSYSNISANGKSRVLNGTMYGFKNFFDD